MSSHEHTHHHDGDCCGCKAKPVSQPRVLSCKEVGDFLMAFLDKELPEAQQDEFARHIAMCPPCAEYMRTYQDTIKLCKGALNEPCASVEPSEKPPEKLIAAILASRKK